MREKIAKWFVDNLRFDYAIARLAADQILALEGEDWRIAVVEKVSDPPMNPHELTEREQRLHLYTCFIGCHEVENEARIKEGWVKEVKDE